MVYEFEGKTEQEAIDTAAAELDLRPEEFEIEILEAGKTGIFSFNKKVKIRVHVADNVAPKQPHSAPEARPADGAEETKKRTLGGSTTPETDFEHALVDFVTTLTERMGFPSDVQIMYREPSKIGMRLDSPHSNILIGRKGKNLDALQLLVNVMAGRLDENGPKVVLDAEGYRGRREENLVRLAHKVGDQVKRSKGSRLLEPMNPFERRLIHTALNDIADIGTESQGEGLYKQVRIFYRGQK